MNCPHCGRETCLTPLPHPYKSGSGHRKFACHGQCSQEPLKKECGNLITCKDRSLKDGETLRDHLQKNHPELFTKEHQEMFRCRAAPIVDIKLEVLLEPIRKIVEAYQTAEEEREKLLKGFAYAGPPKRTDYFTPITDLFDELANAYQQLDDDYWANVSKHELDRSSFLDGPLGPLRPL